MNGGILHEAPPPLRVGYVCSNVLPTVTDSVPIMMYHLDEMRHRLNLKPVRVCYPVVSRNALPLVTDSLPM